jgi:hypothetical protein
VFNGAVGWLRERQVLLPAVTTLARLVARERDAATLRVWSELAQPVSGGQARLLRGLLVVPEGSRRSELDRMCKAETVTSGAGMVRALRRVSDVAGLGLGGLDVSAVPHRRVVSLARYGMAAKATALRRHPEPRHSRELDGAWRALSDGLVAGSEVHVDADGRLHADKVDAIPDPPSLVDLRRRLEAMLPRVDLPDLILEVMAWHPEFVAAFAGVSGGRSRLGGAKPSFVAPCLASMSTRSSSSTVQCSTSSSRSIEDRSATPHHGSRSFVAASREPALCAERRNGGW